MELKDGYTLKDFESYAHKEFPVEFETITNAEAYGFESRLCWNDPIFRSRTGRLDVLRFAYAGYTSVWAHSDGACVRYFQERRELLHQFEPTFRVKRRVLLKDFQGLFAYVMVAQNNEDADMEQQRYTLALARQRFDLLVHITFLITGRIKNIGNLNKADLLGDFKDLCVHVHGNKLTEGGAEATVVDLTAEASPAQMANANSTSSEIEHPVITVRRFSERNSNMVSRGSKRPVTDPYDVADNTFTQGEPIYTSQTRTLMPSHNPAPHKRTRTSTSSTVSNVLAQPSQQVQTMFEALLVQSKTENEAQWTREKQDLGMRINDLEAQLASEKERAKIAEDQGREWQDKYTKLKGRVADLVGDD